jgi:hypothetical protein
MEHTPIPASPKIEDAASIWRQAVRVFFEESGF